MVGPDDFASMKEVITRRYERLVKEGKPLPQLIVVDGGKGQLSAAVDALKKTGVYSRVKVIAIAKKLELIYRPGDPHPLFIPQKNLLRSNFYKEFVMLHMILRLVFIRRCVRKRLSRANLKKSL